MIAAILLSVVVGALAEPSVHVVPHAKTAVHEVAHDVHRKVGLIHQVPFIQREVKLVHNEVPRIITKPRVIHKTVVRVQKYNYDKPFIRKHTIIKPVQVIKKFDVHKTVDVPTPIHRVRTVVKPVKVDQPYPKVIVKKKVQYKENRIFRPKPVIQERVHIRKQQVPVPITEHVYKNVPQPRLVVQHVPFDIVKHVHQVKKQPVPVARVKTVGVQVPIFSRKQIHVPVAKSHGGGYESTGKGGGGFIGGGAGMMGGAAGAAIGGGFMAGGPGIQGGPVGGFQGGPVGGFQGGPVGGFGGPAVVPGPALMPGPAHMPGPALFPMQPVQAVGGPGAGLSMNKIPYA